MDIKEKAASSTTNPMNYGGKDSGFRSQYQIVYQSFKERPKTMLDVFLETGILRANICWYVADMEDKGLIQLLYKMDTKFKAGYLPLTRSCFVKLRINS